MIKVSGKLDIERGFVRLKPNIPFIGAFSSLVAYEINNGEITIELSPTPQDRVYLADYSLSRDGAFLATETWIVPAYDCSLDEVRGIISFKQNAQMQLQIDQLLTEKNDLTTQLNDLKAKHSQALIDKNLLIGEIDKLQLENKQLEVDKNLLLGKLEQIGAIAG